MTRLIDALRTVPRVDASAWAALPVWTRWAIAARASVLGMTLASAAIGGLVALRSADFSLLLWLLAAIGLLAAHASNNLINDWIDSARGLDRGDYHRARYGTHALGAGLLSARQMALYLGCTAAVALASAALAVAVRGAPALWLAAAGAFFVLFYTWPLKGLGLGEPAVLLVWGPLMTGGTFHVACGAWSWSAAALGTAYALGPTAVLFGKHLDKRTADAARGIRTLPVLIGERAARRGTAALLVLLVVLPPALAVAGLATPWLLLCLLAAPRLRRVLGVFAAPAPRERPARFPESVWPLWYAPHAFALTRRVAALLLLALVPGLFS